MTKADIAELIYERLGNGKYRFSKKESAEMVEQVLGIIKDSLIKGEKIKIAGFGNFHVKSKKDRIGRNPQTGEAITIGARRVLTFKPSPMLKEGLNG
jgi:integration host factor subunit alpha